MQLVQEMLTVKQNLIAFRITWKQLKFSSGAQMDR